MWEDVYMLYANTIPFYVRLEHSQWEVLDQCPIILRDDYTFIIQIFLFSLNYETIHL
jgi:hypothetical protein